MIRKFFIACLLLALGSALFSLEIPALKGRVNDYADILKSGEEQRLEQLLLDVEEQTSSQLVLLTINSLEGDSLEDFSMRVVESWKIGQADRDNGCLLLIALNERKLRIEVGYGLEGIVTDLKAGYIIREQIIPSFKRGDFYKGINNGLSTLAGLIKKDFDISPEELARYKKGEEKTGSKHIPFGLIVFIIFIILSSIGRPKGGQRRNRSLLPFIFFGGGGGGGGGFGGFGGGGFSGGGGGFGGGGASGGW